MLQTQFIKRFIRKVLIILQYIIFNKLSYQLISYAKPQLKTSPMPSQLSITSNKNQKNPKNAKLFRPVTAVVKLNS